MAETNTQRRTFLTIVASSVAVAACGGGGSSPSTPVSSPVATPSTAKTPLTIDAFTSTDLPTSTQVYAYIVGEVQANGVNNQYRLDASGKPHLISTTDNAQAKNTFPDSSLLSSADATTIACRKLPIGLGRLQHPALSYSANHH